VWSGDAKLREVRGVNLVVMAGDAKAGLRLTENEHSLDVWSGDADVEILSGSSVKAHVSVLSGDANVTTNNNVNYQPFETVKGQQFDVSMGSSVAQLQVSVKAGDLSLEAKDD
jgi:hypothetical protein